VIHLAVMYVRFRLSLRNVEYLLAERGIDTGGISAMGRKGHWALL